MVVVSSLNHRLLRPHGLQPARLLCPRDSPGKNPGGGCHFPLQPVLCLVSIVDICQSESPNSPLGSLRLRVYFCFGNKIIDTSLFFFQIPHICVHIGYFFFCFGLTSLCVRVSSLVQISSLVSFFSQPSGRSQSM